jgi:ribonuclease P protein subunit POP4
MSDSIHMPFLARNIHVTESTDPTLVGISGQVLEETRHTIVVQTSNGKKVLAKDVINFTLDLEDKVIEGFTVTRRPEDRINRKYRRN